jgi:hypothetical protein
MQATGSGTAAMYSNYLKSALVQKRYVKGKKTPKSYKSKQKEMKTRQKEKPVFQGFSLIY